MAFDLVEAGFLRRVDAIEERKVREEKGNVRGEVGHRVTLDQHNGPHAEVLRPQA
jgi:hypothetical protein